MDVDRFLARAEAALRKRDPAAAVALYRQVLRARPGDARGVAGMLAAFRRGAELKGGPSLLDRTAAKGLLAAARGASAARKPAAAARSAEAGLQRDPTDASLAALLAAAYEQLGQADAALAAWEHRLALDERDVAALKGAGRLHYAGQRIDRAVECFELAHAADPHDPEVERMRKALAAEHTLAATRFATAASSRELVKDPGAAARRDEDARLAELDRRLGAARQSGDEAARKALEVERARAEVAACTRRLDADPAQPDLRLRLARAHYRLDQTDQAIAQFQAIADDQRLRLDAQQGLGACFLRKGLFPLAARQFLAALDGAGGVRTERGRGICYHLGLVCERMGDTSGALQRYLQVYEVDIHYKDVAAKIEALKR